MNQKQYHNRKILVTAPKNVSTADAHLFEDDSYQIHPLRILEIEDAIVTYSGIVFLNNRIVKETIHGYAEKSSQFYNHGINEIAQAKNIYMLKGESSYLIIHSAWFNYYHWITESIPRLWSIKEKLNELTLLLPAHYERNKYVQESLEAFNLSKLIYIPRKVVLKVKKIVVPQLKPICNEYYPVITNQIRSFYLSYVRRNNKSRLNLGKKIYISRTQSRRRKISNESDTITTLAKHGFCVIHAEHYSFFDQVALFSNVDHLISIHGAGLTNTQFMESGSSVLELHKKITNKNDHHSLCYWYLASSLNIKYFQQLCDPIDFKADFYVADLYINTRLLEENILKMLLN